MINDYSIWYLAYRCLGWYQNLQNESNTNRKLMEIDADDAEPIHITGEGGDDLKCHMTILTTSYNNHTILDQPPNYIRRF